MKTQILLCSALACLAVTARSAEISGEIFVVTAGHQSIKLGLVTVRVFRPDQISAIVIETRETLGPEIEDLRKLQHAALPLEDKVTKVNDLIIKGSNTDLITESTQLFVDATLLVKRIQWRLDYLESAAPFFERLPQSIASAKTDSDGKFRIAIPDNSDVIVGANTSRKVPDDTENYFWLVKVKPAANVTLSNDNSSDARSTDSVIQTSALSGSPGTWTADSLDKLRVDAEALKNRAVAFAKRIGAQDSPVPQQETYHSLKLTKSVELKNSVGRVIAKLEQGQSVQYVAFLDNYVRVRYEGRDYDIRISATDLK